MFIRDRNQPRRWRVTRIFGVLAGALILGSGALAQSVEITAESEIGTLTGTLELASSQTAAALILPGSGPTDRNGNTEFLGLVASPYRLLAEGLAAQGISTARIDKRGVGGSAREPVDPPFSAYVSDTALWVDTVIAETGAACVWLLGHSEGSMISALSANDPDVCGLVLLAPPGRVVADIFYDQIRVQPTLAPVLPTFQAAVAALMAGQEPVTDGLPENLALMFVPQSRPLMRDLLSADPAAFLAQSDVPALIIHGDADFQTPPVEAAPLMAARPDAVARTLTGMTHMLKPSITRAQAPSEEAWVQASLATYSNPNLPLHPELVPLIAGFINGGDAPENAPAAPAQGSAKE